MIVFILLFIFAMIGVAWIIVGYSANQRRRAGQSGIDAVNEQQSTRHPRATPPDT